MSCNDQLEEQHLVPEISEDSGFEFIDGTYLDEESLRQVVRLKEEYDKLSVEVDLVRKERDELGLQLDASNAMLDQQSKENILEVHAAYKQRQDACTETQRQREKYEELKQQRSDGLNEIARLKQGKFTQEGVTSTQRQEQSREKEHNVFLTRQLDELLSRVQDVEQLTTQVQYAQQQEEAETEVRACQRAQDHANQELAVKNRESQIFQAWFRKIELDVEKLKKASLRAEQTSVVEAVCHTDTNKVQTVGQGIIDTVSKAGDTLLNLMRMQKAYTNKDQAQSEKEKQVRKGVLLLWCGLWVFLAICLLTTACA